MSGAELNAEVIEQLGAGNLVGPREALKAQVEALLQRLERTDQGEGQVNLAEERQLENFIEGISGELQGFLAVAAPLIEYGGDAGQEAVVTALARLAQEIERRSQTPGWEQAMYSLVSRLLWVTAAFALACDAIEFVPRLRRVTAPSHYEDRSEPMLDASRARYLPTHDGDAGRSFEAHERWLTELDLIAERYPLLARDDEITTALIEADLLFAMHAVASGGHNGPYSHGARPGGGAEKRLRARAIDPNQRAVLAGFFETEGVELERQLNTLYGALHRQPGMWMGESQVLFPVPGG